MINVKLLKNSARLSSSLCEHKSGALDLDFKRLQGPISNYVAQKSTSEKNRSDKTHITLNGHPIILKTIKDEESKELMVVLEEDNHRIL